MLPKFLLKELRHHLMTSAKGNKTNSFKSDKELRLPKRKCYLSISGYLKISLAKTKPLCSEPVPAFEWLSSLSSYTIALTSAPSHIHCDLCQPSQVTLGIHPSSKIQNVPTFKAFRAKFLILKFWIWYGSTAKVCANIYPLTLQNMKYSLLETFDLYSAAFLIDSPAIAFVPDKL